jgi:branched-chain amino acid transport system substrate-binding protein
MWRRTIVLLCVLALLAPAGCTAAGGLPAAPATIKLGLVAPFEGRYRDSGYDVIWAVRLAVREHNLARQPGDPIVDLVAYDDSGDPALALEQARKLGVDPHVLGVIGHWRPETTRAAAATYQDLALPLVTADLLDDRTVYSFAPDDAALGRALGNYVAGLRLRRAAIVGPGTPVVQAFSSTLALAGGQVVLHVEPAGEEWVGRVAAADPQVVFLAGDGLAAGAALAALSAGRVRALWVGGPELAGPEFRGVAGALAEGTTLVTGRPLPADLPAPGDFVARYRAVAFGGAPPGAASAPAYEAAELLLDAMLRAARNGAPTRAGVARALESARRDGLLGSLYFNADRRWPAAPVFVYVVRDGRLVQP